LVEACGIILAGGNGLRLRPLTLVLNKHLLPVYDKPMIFYPLSTLMLAGIRDIAIITRPEDIKLYSDLFSNPEDLGISIRFLTQEKPLGVPEAYLIAEKFIGRKSVALILGDNIFVGQGLGRTLSTSIVSEGAKIFSFPVSNPQDYGVIKLNQKTNKAEKIIEKPKTFVSNLAVPGLYFTGSEVVELAKLLDISDRGELEISDLLNLYISNGQIEVNNFQRGIGWIDAGTINSLYEASNLVKVLQARQGFIFNSPDEIAWRNKWISDQQLEANSKKYVGTGYGEYLKNLLSIM
jgi:glucose-1-phosphate thymidylyltransferase